MAALGLAVLMLVVGGAVAMWRSDPARALARREAAWQQRIQPGDVLLQDLGCGLRCNLIRDLTHSRYTQVGLVLEHEGQREVWEAFGPVAPVPLATWVDRGKEGRVAIYRPTFDLAPVLPRLAAAAESFRNAPFDTAFQWDDARLYGAELVAKVFARAGAPLLEPHPMGPGAFKDHEKGVKGLTALQLTEQTPVVMPVDFTKTPRLHKVVDELEGLEP
jgi:hypothetical protein